MRRPSEPGQVASLRLAGDVRVKDATDLWQKLQHAGNRPTVDLSEVGRIDDGVIALLLARGAELVGVPDKIRPLIDLYVQRGGAARPTPVRKCESAISQIGRATLRMGHELRNVVAFFGELVLSLPGIFKRPRTGHLGEVPLLIERTGADAVPIVVLINFLVGFVMAYQSARQLQRYGANLYVADLVGISVTRELAPLMTAIIVCGRSGAAFAAEIATMKVSEEVDALRTLGLRPFAWLVVPRVLALLVVVPSLTIFADIIGILGGLFVAVTSLGLTTRGYFVETQTSVLPWDVMQGVTKSIVFALTIALISCQQGFAASGGAEGVGRRTTSTVVTILFALVIFDAIVTVIFRAMGH